MYTCGFRINAKLVKEGSFRINAKLVKEDSIPENNEFDRLIKRIKTTIVVLGGVRAEE